MITRVAGGGFVVGLSAAKTTGFLRLRHSFLQLLRGLSIQSNTNKHLGWRSPNYCFSCFTTQFQTLYVLKMEIPTEKTASVGSRLPTVPRQLSGTQAEFPRVASVDFFVVFILILVKSLSLCMNTLNVEEILPGRWVFNLILP